MEYFYRIISFNPISRSRKKDSFSGLPTTNEGGPQGGRFGVDRNVLDGRLVNDVEALVRLPAGIDADEWIATQTVMLFENINLLCGCLEEHCTPLSCPDMTGPNNLQYIWSDYGGRKAHMAACEYIDCTLASVQECLFNEFSFPTKYGNTFPNDFRLQASHVHDRLGHILVHAHHAHLSHLGQLRLSPHYTTILHHFLAFNRHFSLASSSDFELFTDVLTFLDGLTSPSTIPSLPPAFHHTKPSDMTFALSNDSSHVPQTTTHDFTKTSYSPIPESDLNTGYQVSDAGFEVMWDGVERSNGSKVDDEEVCVKGRKEEKRGERRKEVKEEDNDAQPVNCVPVFTIVT